MPTLRASLVLLAVLTLMICAAAGSMTGRAETGADPLAAMIGDPLLARSDYIENCGGCHGVDGRSAPAQLPELQGRVGYFMCTPDSRAYLIRLPNIAHSRITDNQQLADLVNYVIFGIGGTSAPRGTKPFTEAEVAHERQFALSSVSLKAERARHVESAIRKCGAPASLRQLFVMPAPTH
ncbi:cytochrome C [Sphingobium nicotianae]|uniref:cytochrome C n=1 Tax=Sphingobium nicotianae TaxID=2782607 RepID=UPI0020331109|nr:cytochrome C [Sphingobium nicotianae]